MNVSIAAAELTGIQLRSSLIHRGQSLCGFRRRRSFLKGHCFLRLILLFFFRFRIGKKDCDALIRRRRGTLILRASRGFLFGFFYPEHIRMVERVLYGANHVILRWFQVQYDPQYLCLLIQITPNAFRPISPQC